VRQQRLELAHGGISAVGHGRQGSMAACSISSSRLWARIPRRSASPTASTRCWYQSTASSSSMRLASAPVHVAGARAQVITGLVKPAGAGGHRERRLLIVCDGPPP
jgi:hypothetical protein